MKPPPFDFLDAPRVIGLVDHELELVEPDLRHIPELVAACHHPLTRKQMPAQAETTTDSLRSFLTHNPRGRTLADPGRGIAPGYTFWMRLRPVVPLNPRVPLPETAMGGSISLRIGHSQNLDLYLGNIGYHVLPPARGHRFAERACRLLLPLARAHGHTMVWITCNPDNTASQRTIESLGAVYVNTVPVPKDNSLYGQGDRHKLRYRLDL